MTEQRQRARDLGLHVGELPSGPHDALTDVAGMAADATYLYVAGTVAGVEGVHRLARADLATA